MPWKKYTDLEPIRRLRYEGRELLGNRVLLTEKRDGSNISLWLDENKQIKISSHNLELADESLQNSMRGMPEYPKIVELLNDEYQGNIVIYGEMLYGVGPTRIEPRRKNLHWILFDVYDIDAERYMPYNWVYQLAYHYKIPMVKIVDDFIPESDGELFTHIKEAKKWCKRHRREGVVGKDYHNQIFFKEKIDLPKRPKLKNPNEVRIQYPMMPEEKVLRALQHAFDEVGEENWKDVKTAMPIVAQHISTEAREHFYNTPKNFYQYYVNTPIDLLRSKIKEDNQDEGK